MAVVRKVVDFIKKYGMIAAMSAQFTYLFYAVFDLKDQVKQLKKETEKVQALKVDRAEFLKYMRAILNDYEVLVDKINKINDLIRVFDPVTGESYRPLGSLPHGDSNSTVEPYVRVYLPTTSKDVYCPKQEGALFICPEGVRVK